MSAIGTVASAVESNKARKEQAKARAVQQRQAEIANARQRRRALAQQRVQAAQVESGAEATGIAGGSTVSGALSAAQTQTAESIGFGSQVQSFAQEQQRFLDRAGAAAGRADAFGAAAQVAGGFAGQFK